MNANSPTTINKWLQEAQKQLKSADIPSYPLDALLLLEHVTKYDRAHILAHPEKDLTHNQVQHLQKLLARRIKREPLAYIVEKSEFYGHSFYINQHVLVPRPESEAFIDLLATIRDARSLLDVGCGSGAIGISAKLARPNLEVTLVDISKQAVVVAQHNADKLNVNVKTVEQDLFGKNPVHYDVVCANLPYVPKDLPVEKELSFEPSIALYSESNGMDHYQRFWRQVSPVRPKYIMTENLKMQHNQQLELAQAAGYTLRRTVGLVQLFELS